MNDILSEALIKEVKTLNKTLDCIAKELKLISRGDLK